MAATIDTQAVKAYLLDLQDRITSATGAVDGKLNEVELTWDRRIALGVALAAANYPENPKTGDAITGIPV